LLVWGFAAAVWLLANADEKLGMPFSESFIETLTRWGLREEYSAALLPAIGYIVAIGLVIVMICSVARRIWENEKFG
jgi:phosphotransferase system  glucose/maltose/N-acetylglucosamine-specific IIC component